MNTTDIGDLWRHRKTGHVYVVVGTCLLEATNCPAILYRRVNGACPATWARDRVEFFDGRFEPIPVDEEAADMGNPISEGAHDLQPPETAPEPASCFTWSGPFPPDEYCSYDHVIAETPVGRVTIEWKGWKSDDPPGADLPWPAADGTPVFICEMDLESAKAAVEASWQEFAARVAAFPGPAHETASEPGR